MTPPRKTPAVTDLAVARKTERQSSPRKELLDINAIDPLGPAGEKHPELHYNGGLPLRDGPSPAVSLVEGYPLASPPRARGAATKTTPLKMPAVTDLDVAKEMVRRRLAVWVGSGWGDDPASYSIVPGRSFDKMPSDKVAPLFERRKMQVRDELVRAAKGDRRDAKRVRDHAEWRAMAVGFVREGASRRLAVRMTVAIAAGEGVSIDGDNLLKRVRAMTK